jgi:hypothetical protein
VGFQALARARHYLDASAIQSSGKSLSAPYVAYPKFAQTYGSPKSPDATDNLVHYHLLCLPTKFTPDSKLTLPFRVYATRFASIYIHFG